MSLLAVCAVLAVIAVSAKGEFEQATCISQDARVTDTWCSQSCVLPETGLLHPACDPKSRRPLCRCSLTIHCKPLDSRVTPAWCIQQCTNFAVGLLHPSCIRSSNRRRGSSLCECEAPGNCTFDGFLYANGNRRCEDGIWQLCETGVWTVDGECGDVGPSTIPESTNADLIPASAPMLSETPDNDAISVTTFVWLLPVLVFILILLGVVLGKHLLYSGKAHRDVWKSHRI